MDEAKRNIRYIIPGLALLPQLILAVYFYDKSMFLNIFLDKSKDSLSIVLAAFFASGILGYIFSSIYFVIHWIIAFKLTNLDYRSIVTKKENAPLFKDFEIEGLCQSEADVTMSVCWKMKCENKYLELDKMERTFGNTLHSIGTTLMIMIFGLVIGLLILHQKYQEIKTNFIWYLIINVVIIAFLCANYWIVANMLQTLREQAWCKLRKDIIENKNQENFGS